jgi:hypothetical protein
MDDFKHIVPITGFGQATHEQCWYASFQMIFSNANRSIGSVDDLLDGAGIDVDDAKANGLTDTDYAKACDALGLTGWSGSKFNKEAGTFDFGVSDGAWAFIDELKKRPLWVSKVSGSSYHAIVAVGYRDEGDKILWNNPYPGPKNAVEGTPVYANTFVRIITNAKCSVMGKKV